MKPAGVHFKLFVAALLTTAMLSADCGPDNHLCAPSRSEVAPARDNVGNLWVKIHKAGERNILAEYSKDSDELAVELNLTRSQIGRQNYFYDQVHRHYFRIDRLPPEARLPVLEAALKKATALPEAVRRKIPPLYKFHSKYHQHPNSNTPTLAGAGSTRPLQRMPASRR